MNRRNFIATAAALLAAPHALTAPAPVMRFVTYAGPAVCTLPAGFTLHHIDYLLRVNVYKDGAGNVLTVTHETLWRAEQ